MKREHFILAIAVLFGFNMLVEAQIDGKSGSFNLKNEAEKVTASLLKSKYESHEALVPASQTDYCIKAQLGAFSATKVPRAHNVIIRTDADITFKFNGASQDSISLSKVEKQMSWNRLEVTDICFTTTGAANVKVILN